MKKNKAIHSPLRLAFMLRDSRTTKGAQRTLLMALVLRCNPNKGYICWPSYRLLADDTQLDAITLRRAAKALEDKGLIRRKQRATRSNIFIVNAELLEQHSAEARLAREKEKLSWLPDASPLPTSELDEGDYIAPADEDVLAAVTGGR